MKNKFKSKFKQKLSSRKKNSRIHVGTIKTVPEAFYIVLEEYLKGVNLGIYFVREIIDQLVEYHNHEITPQS